MAYTKQTWTAGSGGGTPLSAGRFQHIEDGLEAVANGANLFLALALVSDRATTVTAAGTTTLTIADKQVQLFTGTTTQTVKLPTTGVIAGQTVMIINASSGAVTVQSSGASTIATVGGGRAIVVFAKVDTPTAGPDWAVLSAQVAMTAQSYSAAQRDSNASLFANMFVPNLVATATAAATTTLTVGSAEIQVFTGTTTQTVVLPTTGVVAGQSWEIINTSTGAITVNASGGASVGTVAAGTTGRFRALQATPTTAAHWARVY